MSEKIFISYRREDSRGVTGRIYDRLEDHFGRDRIFMDVDTIRPGMDFVAAIEKAVDASDVFLVVIGPNWATSLDAAGNRRLANPEDFVRLEVSAALARDVQVIPVLVENAIMPYSDDLPDDLKPLTRRNAIEISHTRFSMDADRLIRVLEEIFEPSTKEQISVKREISKSEIGQQMKAERPGDKTKQPSLPDILPTIIYWTIGGIAGGFFHWYPYVSIFSVFFYAGTSGLLSGVGLGVVLRNKKPDSWIIQVPLALIGNILVGSFIRGLFVLHVGDIIIAPLLIPPLVTGALYGLLKALLSKR